MSDVNADLRAKLKTAVKVVSYNDLHQFVLAQEQFQEIEDVALKMNDAGVVEVKVKPRWLEPEVVSFLSGSDMVPVGVAFIEGNPMTNFHLKPGLTLVVGTAGAGKTKALLCIGEELHAEGVDVRFMSPEGIGGIIEHFKPPFPIDSRGESQDLLDALKDTRRGDALLVDDLIYYADSFPLSTGGFDKVTRKVKTLCRNLGDEAQRRGIYLVMSVQAKRPMGNDDIVQVSTDLQHSYPIIEVRGSA